MDEPTIIASITAAGGEPLVPLLIDGYALPITVRCCGEEILIARCLLPV